MPQDDYSLLRSHNGRLITASTFANEKFLGTPYGSTPIHARLFNQRFLIELTDNNNGNKIYFENNTFYSAQNLPVLNIRTPPPVAVKVTVTGPMPESITYNDACCAISKPTNTPQEYQDNPAAWVTKRDAFLQACEQGYVKIEPDIAALEAAGFTVNHVIHRPNHGLHHSMRAAASIPLILGFNGVTKSPEEIEKLQHMMLFSVVGRLDETGFHETGEYGDGINTYQRFRTTSGLAYLDYCGSKDGIYTVSEKADHAHYRDALTVELMGFYDVQEALQAYKGDALDIISLKDRILKDTKKLIEMGTLTATEADSLDHALDKDKQADELVAIVRDSKNHRYVLESAIPGVLVKFIAENYETVKKYLTPQQCSKIEPLNQADRATVIKTLLPQILENSPQRDLIFPFINPASAINNGLKWMNASHGYDLSRCYELEAKYPMYCMMIPEDVDMKAQDWEKTLTTKLNQENKQDIDRLEKTNGFVVLKKLDAELNAEFYIRHSDDKNNIQYSLLENGLLALDKIPLKITINMPHSWILAHIIAKKGAPAGKSQFYGYVQDWIDTCFKNSTSWDTFKPQMEKLYEFVNAIQEMHLRTGERIYFKLHKKEEFQAFLEKPAITALYEEYKKDPNSFGKKFTIKACSMLYNAEDAQDYDYPKAFRIFAGTPAVTNTRNYRAEAANCARLIDSSPKPAHSLKTDQLPEIQTLKYEPSTKEMTLTFTSQDDATSFQQLHQELIQPSSNALIRDDLSVTIPKDDYIYLRDNRHLRYKLETVPKTINQEEDLLDPDTGEYRAIQLIKQQRGVIRLHDTVLDSKGQHPYEYELTNMADPMHNRRVTNPKRLHGRQELAHLNQRIKIQSPQTLETRDRGVELEPTPPDPQYQEPTLPELDHPDLDSDAIYQQQGGVKNTRFIKKAPYTLLNPAGTSQLFMGAMFKRNKYMPVGILCDLDHMHSGGGKYIWTGRVNSWDKLWLRGVKKERSLQELSALPQGITLEQLKKQQQDEADPRVHNELLLRATKDAIRALTATKNTLIDRLNLAAQAMIIKEKFGISVPLIILDPTDHECPKPYTEEMMRHDIQATLISVREHQFKYDDSRTIPDYDQAHLAQYYQRDEAVQNQVITQLLSECGFTVTSDQTLTPKLRLSVPSPLHADEDQTRIENYLQKLSVPGGKYAELKQISNSDTFDALPMKKKNAFFIKQFALGYNDVLEKLIDTCQYKPSKETLAKAQNITALRQMDDCAWKLSLKNLATQATKNINNITIPTNTGLSYSAWQYVLNILLGNAVDEYRQGLIDIVHIVKGFFNAESPHKERFDAVITATLKSTFEKLETDGSKLESILPADLNATRKQLEQLFNEYFVAADQVNVTPIVSAPQPLPSEEMVVNYLTAAIAKIKLEECFREYVFGEDLFEKTKNALEKMQSGLGNKIDQKKIIFLQNILSQYPNNIRQLTALEALTDFQKNKDALDQAIILARKTTHQTPQLTALITQAEQIHQSLLNEPEKSWISHKLQEIVNQNISTQKELIRNVVSITSDSRNYTSSMRDQLQLARLRYQYKNDPARSPINESCKPYLLALNESHADKVSELLDAMWGGTPGEVDKKLAVISALTRETGLSYENQIDMAELRYQYKNDTARPLITVACKDYLLSLDASHADKVSELLDAMWGGTPGEVDNKLAVISALTRETGLSYEKQIDMAKLQYQFKNNKLSPITVECKLDLLALTTSHPGEVHKLLDAMWNGQSDQLNVQLAVILKLTRERKFTYTEQIDMAISEYKNKNQTKKNLIDDIEIDDIDQTWKPYLLALEASHSSEVLELLDAIWGDDSDKLNAQLDVISKLPRDKKPQHNDRNHPYSKQLRMSELQFQYRNNTKSPILEERTNYCVSIFAEDSNEPEVMKLLDTMWNGTLDEFKAQLVVSFKLALEIRDAWERPTPEEICILKFEDKHKELFASDKAGSTGFFKLEIILSNKPLTLAGIITHAQNSSHIRQACIALHWMDSNGNITEQAPEIVKKIAKNLSNEVNESQPTMGGGKK